MARVDVMLAGTACALLGGGLLAMALMGETGCPAQPVPAWQVALWTLGGAALVKAGVSVAAGALRRGEKG